ncbi:MAG: pantetheine-phosphate adenylyltransferase [Armatimonadetes bacterium]|nr:pantetheine-phosphate adenylyltransferase [Armatimonadota bacterium]
MKALYPGTFDPVTNGHLDVIERAAGIFPELVVAAAVNPSKLPTFALAERLAMLRESTAHLPGVSVGSIPGLLVEFARAAGAKVIVKGLRAVSDFEFEFQMAQANRTLNSDVETVFMMTAHPYSFLSSSLVKQVAELGGDVSGWVPEPVLRRLLERRARG